MQMRILLSFLCLLLYGINWRSFYHLIIYRYYINKNIYCKSSAIKSLMEFWNMNPIEIWIQLKSESYSNVSPCDVVLLLQIASSQSNRHKYRLRQNHRSLHHFWSFVTQNIPKFSYIGIGSSKKLDWFCVFW